MIQELWIPGAPYPERRKQHAIVYFPKGVYALAGALRRGLKGKRLAPFRAGAARVQLYPHPKTEVWRKRHVEPAIAAAKLERIPKPKGVEVVAVFYLPRPKSHMGTGRNEGMVKASSPAFPIGSDTGDAENLLKVICDALTKVLWDDDSQVIRARIDKLYADDGQEPGVRFHARPLAGTVGELRSAA